MDLDMKYETSWPSQAIWNVQYLFLCDKTSNKIEHSKKDSLCQTDLCHNITTSPSEMNLNSILTHGSGILQLNILLMEESQLTTWGC